MVAEEVAVEVAEAEAVVAEGEPAHAMSADTTGRRMPATNRVPAMYRS